MTMAHEIRRSRCQIPAHICFVLLVLLITMQGCSLFGRGSSRVRLVLNGAERLNACGGVVGNALGIRIYQLKDRAAIEKATLLTLWQDDQSVLGDDFVSREGDLMLAPGAREIRDIEIRPEANYLAVVGNFCQVEGSHWCWFLSVRSLGSQVTLSFGESQIEDVSWKHGNR